MSANGVLSDYLVPNVFDPNEYYELDVRLGVMKNRFGTKCCTFSGHLLKGLYLGLVHETGPAAKLVMRSCGETWGKRFVDRFLNEIREFYGQDLEQMSMKKFMTLVEEYFAVSGWGRVRFNYDLAGAGIIQAEVDNPILGDVLGDTNERMDVLFEGVLRVLFTKVSGQDFDAYETQSVAKGAGSSLFVIGLEDRLEDVPEMLEQGKTHAEIVNALTTAKK